MNNQMTITVTAYGKTVTVTQPDEITVYEFIDTCRNLALAIGYHEENWTDAMIDMGNEYTVEKLKERRNRLA